MKHILWKYAEGALYYASSPYFLVERTKAPCLGAQMQQPEEDFRLATVLVPLIAIYIGAVVPELTTGTANYPALAVQYGLSAYYAQRVHHIDVANMKDEEKGLWYAMCTILVGTATSQHYMWQRACESGDPKHYKRWAALSVVYYTCLLETFESIRGKKWELIKHQFSPDSTIWELLKASTCADLMQGAPPAPPADPPAAPATPPTMTTLF